MDVMLPFVDPVLWLDRQAVVPIVAAVGGGVVPALMAGLVSLASVLFNPRRLWRACVARPWVPLALFALVGLGIGAWKAWPAGGARAVSASTSATATSVGDRGPELEAAQWLQLAHDYLQYKRAQAALQARAAAPVRDAGGGDAAPVAASAAPETDTSTASYFRNGQRRTGYDGRGAPLQLARRWRFVDQPGDFYPATPVVRAGRVYAASCALDGENSYGAVFCLDAESGEALWTRYEYTVGGEDFFKGFWSSPAISADGSRLVIGQGLHLDRDSSLLCLDTATGELLWRVPTPLHIEGSPAIEGDIVVAGAGAVEVGAEHRIRPGDDPGFVFAVRVSTGELLWRHQVVDPESSPVLHGGVCYIGSGIDGRAVIALRARESDAELEAAGLERELWRVETPYPASGAISLADGVVYAGCGKGDFIYNPDPIGLLLALDAVTGEERWHRDLPAAVLGPVAVDAGRALVPALDGSLRCLDAATGEEHWQRVIAPGEALIAGPALTGELVYAVTQMGTLAVLDLADGTVIEQHQLNQRGGVDLLKLCASGPTVAGGRLYVGSETGGVQAFDGLELRP